jgi:hypothetical protein
VDILNMILKKLILLVLCIGFALPAFGDSYTKLQRSSEIFAIPYKASQSELEVAIINSCVRAGWFPKKIDERTIEAKLHIRDHVVVVHVVYNSDSFHVDYADSTNLTSARGSAQRFQIGQNTSGLALVNSMVKPDESDEVRIHKNYYVWIENLENNIIQTLTSVKQATGSPNSIAANGSVSQKLRDLESLRKDGIISNDEYQKKKQQLLDNF